MNRARSQLRYRDLPVAPGSVLDRTTWGLFGRSDEAGTINLLLPDLVRRAASLVQWGTVFSLNRPLDRPHPPLFGRDAYQHVVQDLPMGTDDHIDGFHLRGSSHWDALRHIGHSELGYYNGLGLDDAAQLGVPHLGIEHWASRGIVGRYVLIDVGRHREAIGEPLVHDRPLAIGVDEIEQTLASERCSLEGGDIVLVRFGWTTWYDGLSESERESLAAQDQLASPGLSSSERTAEWLWDHGVAAIASDTPSIESLPSDGTVYQETLQRRLIAFLGMATGSLFMLDELATDCAADGVYEGLFVSAPLHVPGGSGSPANAIAIK